MTTLANSIAILILFAIVIYLEVISSQQVFELCTNMPEGFMYAMYM